MATLPNRAAATILLLAVLGGVFAIELAYAAPGNDAMLLRLGALPDSGGLQGQYWRLLTFGLLHWNVLHLVLNLAGLLFAGMIVERRSTSLSLVALFFISSVVSGLAILIKHHFVPQSGVSVGASGGLFGLLGAAIVLLQRLPPRRLAIRLGLWIVSAAGIAISLVPGVSLVGHVAGLLVGLPAGYLLSAIPAVARR